MGPDVEDYGQDKALETGPDEVIKKGKTEELREYLLEMENYYSKQATLRRQKGNYSPSVCEERLASFCSHLIEKIDS